MLFFSCLILNRWRMHCCHRLKIRLCFCFSLQICVGDVVGIVQTWTESFVRCPLTGGPYCLLLGDVKQFGSQGRWWRDQVFQVVFSRGVHSGYICIFLQGAVPWIVSDDHSR